MGAKFVNVDRETRLLLPVDLREWIPEDDMVHFVIEAVESTPSRVFQVNDRGTGSAQYPPRMMLALLIYCYANGIFSSRRIERATYRDVAVRYLTGDTHPDHDTIAKFRRENFDAIAESFVRVLELARELKLLKLGTVSVDGTKIKANASKHRNVRYDRAGELVEQLDLEVRELLEKAEQSDQQDEVDGQRLPDEVSRREKLKSKLQQARERLEAKAKARAEKEREEYERKLKDRERRSGRGKGKKPKEPSSEPKGKEQQNLTDPDSRLMRKNKRSAYRQAYNAQAAVDADGSQLVVGVRISQCSSDSRELEADVASIPGFLGNPTSVLADSGYACEEEVKAVQGRAKDGSRIEVYVSVGAESEHNRRKHDFRPFPTKERKPSAVSKSDWGKRMKAKLETDEGRALYKLRKQTVEPVFGIMKQAMGFRQFLLRGLDKVSGEWALVCLAYNMKRLHSLKTAV